MKTNKNIGLIAVVVLLLAMAFASCSQQLNPSDVHPHNVSGNAHY